MPELRNVGGAGSACADSLFDESTFSESSMAGQVSQYFDYYSYAVLVKSNHSFILYRSVMNNNLLFEVSLCTHIIEYTLCPHEICRLGFTVGADAGKNLRGRRAVDQCQKR